MGVPPGASAWLRSVAGAPSCRPVRCRRDPRGPTHCGCSCVPHLRGCRQTSSAMASARASEPFLRLLMTAGREPVQIRTFDLGQTIVGTLWKIPARYLGVQCPVGVRIAPCSSRVASENDAHCISSFQSSYVRHVRVSDVFPPGSPAPPPVLYQASLSAQMV